MKTFKSDHTTASVGSTAGGVVVTLVVANGNVTVGPIPSVVATAIVGSGTEPAHSTGRGTQCYFLNKQINYDFVNK